MYIAFIYFFFWPSLYRYVSRNDYSFEVLYVELLINSIVNDELDSNLNL